nr:uncharacterized protein LOC109147873 [Ipomoea batatas]
MDNMSCGFFVRNSRGGFCLAGVYSVVEGGGIDDLITLMLNCCIEWCEQMNYHSVYLETEDWRGVRDHIRELPHLRIMKIQCTNRVNCVAKCLVQTCKGSNVIFCSREGLPRGLGRILALEGIPHFVVAPGVDRVNSKPVYVGVEDAGERPVEVDELINLNKDTPAVCVNSPVAVGEPLVPEQSKDQGQVGGTSSICKNDAVREGELAASPVEERGTEAVLVEQGLAELARKGINVDQFVDEAVLEAAINIIEEAAGNIMKEDEVGEVNEDAQEPHTAINVQVEGLEAGLATPNPTLEGVKENGGGTRLTEMVESDKRSIGSSSSMSFNTWAKGMREKWGPECGKIIDEAKQEVLHFFEKAFKDLGQSKYDEMEPQLLEKAGLMFESKLKEFELKERVEQEKKEWELHEWALLLKEKWNQDEDLGDIIENSLGEIRAYLRNNHGGWLEKFDAKAASEASSILKCMIEASSIGKKYGPKSRLGWGLKCKHLSTGYFLCDWARKYFDGVIDSDGSGSSEESDEE